MKVTTGIRDGVAIIRVHGNMLGGPDTMKTYEEVRAAILNGIRRVLIDVGGVPHLSSGGLGCLLSCRSAVSDAGGSLKILHPARRITEILHITRLMQYFDCFNDEQEALASFPSA